MHKLVELALFVACSCYWIVELDKGVYDTKVKSTRIPEDTSQGEHGDGKQGTENCAKTVCGFSVRLFYW